MVDVARPVAGSSSLEETLSSLSGEEINKFSTHLKDPKFMELFADYAKELADPKARAEQDLYLRQLEQEGRSQEMYGKGTQLVAPEPSFVAKTANKQSGQKIFINVCTSDKVAIATSKRIQDANGTKKSGLHWSIPLILSNCKEGEDRNRIQCMVFDFVIHPGTCRMAMNNARYKALILDTASDNIEKAKGWTLTRQYTYPKLAFKTTEGHDRPQVVSIKQDLEGNPRSSATTGQSSMSQNSQLQSDASSPVVQSSQPTISEVATTSNSHANQSAAKASGFRFPPSKASLTKVKPQPAGKSMSNSIPAAGNSSAEPDQLMTAVTAAHNGTAKARHSSGGDADSAMTAVATTRLQGVELGSNTEGAVESSSGSSGIQPEYELVYRGQVDLGDAWEGPGRNNIPARHPKELVVRVKLPGLKQASQAQLNVTSQQLTVSVPGKYHLHLDLPYAVAEAEGSASFNPAKQQLEVTLPARPPKAPAMPTAQLDEQHLQKLQQGQQQVSASRSDNDQAGAQAQDRQQLPTDAGTSASGSSTASAAQLSKREEDSSITAAQAPSQAGPGQLATAAAAAGEGISSVTDGQAQAVLTENQRRWQELHQPAVGQADAQPAEEAVDMDAMQQAAAAGQEFIACLCFVQHLPGYVFAKRDAGLGYHRDVNVDTDSMPQQPQQQLSASMCDPQQSAHRAPKYLLRPRLVSLAAAEELD